MTIGNPVAVFLFPALMCLLLSFFFLEKRRRKALQSFAQKEVLTKLLPPADPGKARMKAVLLVLAMLFGLTALLRPQGGVRPEKREKGGLDLLFALDVSRSMLAEDVKPNRLERAKDHIRNLVKKLKGDRIGLIAFSGAAVLSCPFTEDYDAFMRVLSDLDVETVSKGGTSVSSAIREGMRSDQGKAEISRRVVLLVTDGEDHGGDAASAARAAGQKGMKIVPIGVGTVEGDLIPVRRESGGRDFLRDPRGRVVNSRLNEPLLKEIALQAGGTYFRPGALEAGFDRIYRNEWAATKKSEGERTGETRRREWFQVPLAIALVCLFLEPLIHLAPRPRRRRSRFPWLGLLLLVLPALLTACERDRVRKARALYEEGRYEEALAEYRSSPDSEIVRFNMGAALYRMGDYERAIECFSKVLTAANADLRAKANYNLGNCKFRLGEQAEKADLVRAAKWYGEARDDYRKAVDLNEKEEDGRYNLRWVEKKLAAVSRRPENGDSLKTGASRENGAAPAPGESGDARRSEEAAGSDGETGAGVMSMEKAEALLEQYAQDEEITAHGSAAKRKGRRTGTDMDW